MLLSAFCFLPFAFCLSSAFCLLPFAFCSLIPAVCLLSSPYCSLLTAHCLLLTLLDLYSILPHLNATLNATSFILLTSGYFFIRRGRVLAHKRCQLGALAASITFLVSYIVYHAHHVTTP